MEGRIQWLEWLGVRSVGESKLIYGYIKKP